MTSLFLVVTLAVHATSSSAAPHSEPDRSLEAPSVVAGASVAGFVGGALFALPAVLALANPTGFGPVAAFGAGALAVAAGAAFGAFLGELSYARLWPSSIVAGIAALGAATGAVVGGLAGAAVSNGGAGGVLFSALVGAAIGGVGSSAAAGALASSWQTPPPS